MLSYRPIERIVVETNTVYNSSPIGGIGSNINLRVCTSNAKHTRGEVISEQRAKNESESERRISLPLRRQRSRQNSSSSPSSPVPKTSYTLTVTHCQFSQQSLSFEKSYNSHRCDDFFLVGD